MEFWEIAERLERKILFCYITNVLEIREDLSAVDKFLVILGAFFFPLTENSLPKPKLPEDSVISSYNISTGYSGLATGNGLSDSPAGSKDHGNVPIIVPLIPPPFIKPSAGKHVWDCHP